MVSSTQINFSYNLGKLAQKKIEVLQELKIIKSKNVYERFAYLYSF